jgi:hypothetical protein
MNAAGEFWQAVADTAYALEGEDRRWERECMYGLAITLDRWLAEHPEVKVDSGSREHYAMHAVRRLAAAFVWNDAHCADLRAVWKDLDSATRERPQ